MIMEGEHRTFGSAAARLPRHRSESTVLDLGAGLTWSGLSAAALDWATHPAWTLALRPGESAVAAVPMEPGIPVPDNRWWSRTRPGSDQTAPLCRRTPKQSGIH